MDTMVAGRSWIPGFFAEKYVTILAHHAPYLRQRLIDRGWRDVLQHGPRDHEIELAAPEGYVSGGSDTKIERRVSVLCADYRMTIDVDSDMRIREIGEHGGKPPVPAANFKTPLNSQAS